MKVELNWAKYKILKKLAKIIAKMQALCKSVA